MKVNINMDKNVVVALSAHGVAPKEIAKYLMQGVSAAVEEAVVEMVGGAKSEVSAKPAPQST